LSDIPSPPPTGEPDPNLPPPPGSAPTLPPASGRTDSPLYCRHCGSPLLADAAFCTSCGQSTAEARATPPPQGAPPPYAQPGYPPPGYPPAPPEYAYAPYPVPTQQKTNGFSIAALVLGIIWIYWIGSILALVFGYVAKSQIDRSQGTQSGRGMAIAGIVLGWVGVGILILVIVLAVIGAASAPGT
jgi:hypothetical protein